MGAKDLHEAGVMNDVTLREFDALCLPASETPPYTPEKQIKSIRQKNPRQQTVFRRIYSIPALHCARKWRSAGKNLMVPSLKLLNLVGLRKGLKLLFKSFW